MPIVFDAMPIYVLANNDKAIKSCLMAITLEPRLAEAYSDLGLAYRNKGKLDLALSV